MILKKLLPFVNVVAAGLASVDLRNLFGYAIDRVHLQLGGTAFTKAMITVLQIKANGKIIFDDTGSRIDARMQYRGETASVAFLTLDFDEIFSKTIIGQKLGSIDTLAGIQSLTAEVTIAGATAPTLAGFAELSAPSNDADRFLMAKVLNFNANFAAAGKFPMAIPYGKQGGTLVKRLHFFGTTITSVEVKKNGISVFEDVPVALNSFLQTDYRKVPQASVYTVDFIADNNQSGVFNAANAQTVEYYVTVNGAGNVACVAEMLDPLTNN